IAFSPTQNLLALASLSSTVKVWRADDGTLVRTFRTYPEFDFPTGVAFSPDGSLLAISCYFGTVQIWRVADGTLVRTIQPRLHYAIPYQNVAFSPDGTLLATGGRGYALVTLWRVDTGEQVAVLGSPNNRRVAVQDFVFSRDSALLAVSTEDGSAFLWRIADGTVVRAIPAAHSGRAYSVDISPDGAFLLTAGADEAVRLWRVADGRLERTLAQGWSAKFSPDGTLVVCVQISGESRLHRVSDGALIATIPAVGFTAFSRDGRLLAITQPWSRDPVTIWNVPQGTLARQLPRAGIRSFTYSADGTLIVTPLSSGGVVLRNAADGTPVRVIAPERQVAQASLSPDNSLVATVERVPDAEFGTYELNLRRVPDGELVRSFVRYRTSHDPDTEPVFSRDGTLLALPIQASSGNSVVRVWRVQDGAVVYEQPAVASVALSPDGTQVALWADTFQVRSFPSGALLFSQGVQNVFRGRVQFSADGTRVALLSSSAYVWRTSNFQLLRNIQPFVNASYSTAYAAYSLSAMSANGAIVATFEPDATIRFWRVDDGAQLLLYDDETGPRVAATDSWTSDAFPRRIEFSPTGRQFAFLRGDGVLVVARNPLAVEGDLNGDGCVNDTDLLLVLLALGQVGANAADANNDGVVNDADLLIVLLRFGQGC
ncbi:MAG: dockerin type I domain-containing protein, partial [Fimbriimonadales bacterium]|nr:dockerin type I domain-containing protein [Fimbriimonadales bacterium]